MPKSHLEAAQFAAIIGQCFPQIAIRDYIIITDGYDSVVLIVNDEYVFRFPRRAAVAAQLAREQRLLPELAKTLPIPIPNFEFTWDNPQPYGHNFVGYRKLAGEPMDIAQLSAAQLAHAAGELAAFLTALHRFPVARTKELMGEAHSAASWHQSLYQLYADTQQKVIPLLLPDLQQQTIALWEGFLGNDANWQFTPRLIHADLGPDHILYDAARAKISGIIDWGDSEVGDPAMDFSGLLYDYGPSFTATVLDAYGGKLDPAVRQRVQFYAELIPYRETLYGIYTDDENHVQEGVGEIAEMLGIRSAHGEPKRQ